MTTPKDIKARRGPSAPSSGFDGRSIPERIQGAQHQIFPPGFYPPYGAKYWFLAGNQVMGPGPVTTTFSGAEATFQVPNGFVGYITELLFLVNNLLLTSDIRFRVLFDGGAVSGFDNFLMPQAAMAVFMDAPEKVFIPIPEGGTVAINVTVTDAVAYNLSVQARGWFYSADQNERWKGLAG